MSKKKKKEVKRKISKKKIFIFLIFICFFLFVINLFNTNITNIYISGNTYFKDQEIIDISKLTNYPKSIANLSFNIEKKLEKNKYIKKAKVTKNLLLNKVYIDIKENYPLYYSLDKNKTILYDGYSTDEEMDSIIHLNYIPDNIEKELQKKLKKTTISILNRISEMEYKPNDRYDDRFLLYMNDGNYVYITLDKFSTLNKYLDIIKYIDSNEKGIIKLDSGQYFDDFEKETS